MRIAITGASGLVGCALRGRLDGSHHQILTLVRRVPVGAAEVGWDPLAGTIDRDALAGLDTVVHLAGEPIAAGRWSRARRS